jgi:hypothetical protein
MEVATTHWMSIITQELLMEEQYNIETSLVSCCFASSKIPQYNVSGNDPIYKSAPQLFNE